jgi:hypothetical protein
VPALASSKTERTTIRKEIVASCLRSERHKVRIFGECGILIWQGDLECELNVMGRDDFAAGTPRSVGYGNGQCRKYHEIEELPFSYKALVASKMSLGYVHKQILMGRD